MRGLYLNAMKSVRALFYNHIFIFAFMFSAVWLANILFNDEVIPLNQIATAALLYCLYSCLIAILIFQYWSENIKLKIFSALIYVFISLTVYSFVRIAVYDILPNFGIRFSRTTQPENLPKFHFRIMSGYLVANLLALLVVWRYRVSILKKERDRINEDLTKFRQRAADLRYTSHFLTTIFLTNFGKMLIDEEPKDKSTKMDIIQFLGYLFEIEKNGGLKSFVEEVDELNCFVRLLKVYYGERAIHYKQALEDINYPHIPSGILFFPLENCLKHASISTDNPITFEVYSHKSGVQIACKNFWSPKDHRVKSETGFSLLHAKLAQVDYHTSVESKLNGNNFCVIMKLNFSEVK